MSRSEIEFDQLKKKYRFNKKKMLDDTLTYSFDLCELIYESSFRWFVSERPVPHLRPVITEIICCFLFLLLSRCPICSVLKHMNSTFIAVVFRVSCKFIMNSTDPSICQFYGSHYFTVKTVKQKQIKFMGQSKT
jgi:hypothetical protein